MAFSHCVGQSKANQAKRKKKKEGVKLQQLLKMSQLSIKCPSLAKHDLYLHEMNLHYAS